MTKPNFTDSISLGNIIQIIVLVGAMVLAFGFIQFQAAANANEVGKISNKQVTLAARTRNIEMMAAGMAVKIQSLQEDISEIKSSIRENHSLLRQLLRITQEN